MSDLIVCQTVPGMEYKAQIEIQKIGFGARVPSFYVVTKREKRTRYRMRPLFPGYVFFPYAPGWSAVTDLHEVRYMVANNGKPSRVLDQERFAQIEMDCLLGRHNRTRYQGRAGNGQFEKSRKPRRSKRIKQRRQTVISA